MQVSMGELLLAGTHPSGFGAMLGLLLHRRPSEGQGDLLPVRHGLLQGSAAVKRSVTPKSSLVNISLWTLCISMTYNDSRLVQATDALFSSSHEMGILKISKKKASNTSVSLTVLFVAVAASFIEFTCLTSRALARTAT